MSAETLIKVEGVSKKFCRNLKKSLWYGMKDLGSELLGRSNKDKTELRPDEFWAVKDVSFELKQGACLGLIGHNGAGKTTILRMLNGLIKPDNGRIEIKGRVGALIALGTGFNPVLTGRENIFVNASILGFSTKEILERLDAIIEFAEIEEFIDTPVQNYSSGMFVRLGFSVAVNFRPDVLLVDEALAVGDLSFTVKCLNRIAKLRDSGTCIIFVSHNELQVREAAKTCYLMHKGKGKLFNQVDLAFQEYNNQIPLKADLIDPDIGYVYDEAVNVSFIRINSSDSDPLIRAGQDVTITLCFMANKLLIDVDIELRFWNSTGHLVSTICTSLINKSYNVPKGRSFFHFHINPLSLSPGEYRLAGGIRRNGEVIGWVRDLSNIMIERPKVNYPVTGIVFNKVEISGPVQTNKNRSYR